MTKQHPDDNQQTTDLRQVLSNRYTVSKRQLGIVLLIGGILGFIGILALDFIGGGREGGIGPSQQAALALMIVVALVGASLIPLGDTPA